MTAALSLNAADGWDLEAGTATLTPSGTLTNGSGGVSLTTATIGSDSKLILKDIGPLLNDADWMQLPTTPSVQTTLNLAEVTTNAFSYSAKFVVGDPTTDKSGKVAVPGTISFSGSVSKVGTGGVKTPIFTGSISLSVQGVGSFDITQPMSRTNFVTASTQLSGQLSLSASRLLTLSAQANASLYPPTPDNPFSLTATYSYVTPKGTAQLNVTGKYDTTAGLSATITNNGGVKVNLTAQANGGAITGTVTSNGTQTATISGSTINYTDGTTESLF